MIDYSYLSFQGDYEINEDHIGIVDLPQRKCFIIADGLGGHGKGEVASSVAVNYAKYILTQCKYIDRNVLKDCFIGAHNQLKMIQENEHVIRGVKTTMVILAIEGEVAYWGHVGDSRLYAFNRFRISEQTKDHSVPQMMVAMGEITEKEIRGNPDRNRLLSALGMDGGIPKIEIHTPVMKVKNGNAFLLCTDGFWEWIKENNMEHCHRMSSSAGSWLEKMAKIVQENGQSGQMDNFSAITVKIR